MPWRFYTSGAQPYTIGSSPVNPASKRQITLRALGQGISRVSLPCRAQTLPPYREGIVSLLPPSSTRARMALRGRNRQRVGSPGGSGSCPTSLEGCRLTHPAPWVSSCRRSRRPLRGRPTSIGRRPSTDPDASLSLNRQRSQTLEPRIVIRLRQRSA